MKIKPVTKLPSLSRLSGELSDYYKTVTQRMLKAEQPIRFDLRASGFPFCALRMAYRKHLFETGKVKDEDSFGKGFYTSVGTAAHLAFQRWMGVGGRIYGAWKCKCGETKRLSNKSRCHSCGEEMEYEELTVRYGTYMSGHVDGVYRAADGRFFILDYKTSTVRTTDAAKKDPTLLPYHGNKEQIKAYVALVEREFGIPIAGWVLLYIGRDNPGYAFYPAFGLVSEKEKRERLAIIDQYDRHYGYLRKGLTHKRVIKLIEEKPCKDFDQYEREYKGHNECPLAPVCFNRQRLEIAVEDLYD